MAAPHAAGLGRGLPCGEGRDRAHDFRRRGVLQRDDIDAGVTGLVDARVHTGEPGEEHKETLESAGIAAAAAYVPSG